MSITDELREWAKEHLSRSSILAIADRIDAEHEAKVSYWQGACYKDGYDEGFASADDWLGQHESDMAEHGWIRLPKDADGIPVHIDDVMEWPDGRTFEVVGIGEGTLFYVEDGGECADWTGASTKRHHHAPTVEDVLQEMLFKAHIYDRREMELLPDLIAEYAKRLTLVEGEDA